MKRDCEREQEMDNDLPAFLKGDRKPKDADERRSLLMVYFVRKRRDLPFHWVFFMFGIFILGCGTTHLMEIWNIWRPMYWLSGGIKAVTAASSVLAG